MSSDNELVYKPSGQEIFLVYFRMGYKIEQYSTEECWAFRRVLEMSRAISCPSVRTQIMNSKIMQYYVKKREFIEENFPGVLTEKEISQVCSFSCEMQVLDDFDNDKAKLLGYLKENINEYILKSQIEGGNSVLGGEEMIRKAESTTLEELKEFMVVKKIDSIVEMSVFLRGKAAKVTPSISELGIFSAFLTQNDTILGDIKSGTMLNRVKVGLFLLYSKWIVLKEKEANDVEGGVMMGSGHVSSCLVV